MPAVGSVRCSGWLVVVCRWLHTCVHVCSRLHLRLPYCYTVLPVLIPLHRLRLHGLPFILPARFPHGYVYCPAHTLYIAVYAHRGYTTTVGWLHRSPHAHTHTHPHLPHALVPVVVTTLVLPVPVYGYTATFFYRLYIAVRYTATRMPLRLRSAVGLRSYTYARTGFCGCLDYYLPPAVYFIFVPPAVAHFTLYRSFCYACWFAFTLLRLV